jgi:uncharacterized protein YbaP (TraB family)
MINPRKEDDYIIDFLKDRQTLITEPGIIFSKDSYTLDTLEMERDMKIQQLKVSDKVKQYTNIINEKDFYQRFIKLHQLVSPDKIYKKSTYLPSFIGLLKGDMIYESLNEIVTHVNPDSKWSINSIKLTNVAKAIYTTLIFSGIDCHLIHYYVSNGLPVYGLDPLMGDKLNSYTDHYLTRSIRLLMSAAILLAKLRKSNIVDEINFIHRQTIDDYLDKSWDGTNHLSEKFIVTGRNKQWLPYMLRYHNETDDPLFVVGAGHLNGKNGLIELLKQQQFEINVFHIKEQKFVELKS